MFSLWSYLTATTGGLLRQLSTSFIIDKVRPETYQQTDFSRSLQEPQSHCWIQYPSVASCIRSIKSTSITINFSRFDATVTSFLELPRYLSRNGYEAPSDPQKGVFQATFDCEGESLFEWYAKHPNEAKCFNDCMTSYSASRTGWVDVYPTEHLLQGSKPEGTLVVDIGGNLGQDLERFCEKHPACASRLILQDLPEVRMEYDFPPHSRSKVTLIPEIMYVPCR